MPVPGLICLFSGHLSREISLVGVYAQPLHVSPLLYVFLALTVWPFLPSLFSQSLASRRTPSVYSLNPLPWNSTLDLKPQQIAQVVQLQLIHQVKYPLAFCSLSVDYSNDDALIFGISLQTYLLINWADPTTHSSCKEPWWWILSCVIMYHYSILNMLLGTASVSAGQIRVIKLSAEMMWHFTRAVKPLQPDRTSTPQI